MDTILDMNNRDDIISSNAILFNSIIKLFKAVIADIEVITIITSNIIINIITKYLIYYTA
jgi:hypothetical protein